MERNGRRRVGTAGFYHPAFLAPGIGQPRTIIQVRPDINCGEITVDFKLSEIARAVGRINSQQDHHVCAFPGRILFHVRHGIVSVV